MRFQKFQVVTRGSDTSSLSNASELAKTGHGSGLKFDESHFCGEEYGMQDQPGDITLLLARLAKGDRTVEPRLISLVYGELHQLAASYMRKERPEHTLQATALVHEAYLNLIKQTQADWQNRANFFGVAAQIMRRILVDHARGRLRVKRAGGQRVSLDEALYLSDAQSGELVAVDDALRRLAQLDPRQSQIVELRFFGGLSVEETAQLLNCSPRTVQREWTLAKAWLHMQLNQ